MGWVQSVRLPRFDKMARMGTPADTNLSLHYCEARKCARNPSDDALRAIFGPIGNDNLVLADLISAFPLDDAAVIDWVNTQFETLYGRPVLYEAALLMISTMGTRWAEIAIEPVQLTALDERFFDAQIHGFQPPSQVALFKAEPSHTRAREIFGPGAVLIGYPRAEMGMGEHVRNSAMALESTSYPFEIIDFDTGLECGLNELSCAPWIVKSPRHHINVFHINADQTSLVRRYLGDRLLDRARCNIGYWAWELERFPEPWAQAISEMDELWAPTKFVYQSLRPMTAKPVVVMPLRVERESLSRSIFPFMVSSPTISRFFFASISPRFAPEKIQKPLFQRFRLRLIIVSAILASN